MKIKLLSTKALAWLRNESLKQINTIKHKPTKFWLREAGIWILVSIVYFVGGKTGLELAFVQSNATAVWPPTGIALAAVLLHGFRIWPAILISAFLVNETTAGNSLTSLMIAAGNTTEAVVGGLLVTKFTGGVLAFDRSKTFVRYVILAAVLATAISATIGVTGLTLTGFSSANRFWDVWLTWWLGDMISNLIVTPWIVLLFTRRWALPTYKGFLAISLTFLFLFVIEGFIFYNLLLSQNILHSLTYLILPLLLAVVFLFGALGVSTAVLGTSIIAISATQLGYGPFTSSEPNLSLLLVQTFLGTIAVSMLIIASILKEREQTQHALVSANERLRDREQQLRFQAFHDTLTNLPNRSALEERLLLTTEIAKRHNALMAVLYIDFDNFKTINDSYGHGKGDQILRLAAERIRNHMRAEDTVARIGGDEFVVLLSEIETKTDVAKVANVILGAFSAPFIINDNSLHLTVSIGISLFPNDGTNISTLLHNADEALYRAKQSGRNRFCFF